MSELESFKMQLENELMKVVSGLETIAVQSPDSGDWVAIPATDELGNADPNVEADVSEEWNERNALVTQLEIQYRNITIALEKIKNGTYGICEISGEPIETARLQANPAARTNMANMDREKELPI